MSSFSEAIENNSLLNFLLCTTNRSGITYHVAVLFYSIFSTSLVIIEIQHWSLLKICCRAGVKTIWSNKAFKFCQIELLL